MWGGGGGGGGVATRTRGRAGGRAARGAWAVASGSIAGGCLPGKAIDVIDESGARVRLQSMTKPPDLKELEQEIEKLDEEKESAVAAQEFEKAAALRDRAEKLRQKVDTTKAQWREAAA